MIESPFPGYVGFAVRTRESADGYRLDPAEARLVSPRMAHKRREEFVLGRAAAHAAFACLGVNPSPPILQGPMREPLWPEGYIGSITHTDGIAACAVCSRRHAAGIGIDLERVPQGFDQDLCEVVATDDERAWIDRDALRLIRLFSAKEAVFKGFFPQTGAHHDFLDTALTWQGQGFRGRLRRSIGAYPPGFEYLVGSMVIRRLVFSFMSLPPGYTIR